MKDTAGLAEWTTRHPGYWRDQARDRGVLHLRRGRVGGIALTEERGCAHAIFTANAYFSTHSVTAAECDKLVRMLNIAIIERAGRCASVSMDPIEQAFSGMRTMEPR